MQTCDELLTGRLGTFCAQYKFARAARMSSDVRRMIDSGLAAFEGMWLASPSGNIVCGKIVGGKLHIPFARSETKKLAGHYFDCRLVDGVLFARFERFGGGESGVLYLKVGEEYTLKGAWWPDDKLPEQVRRDITKAHALLPGRIETVWVRMPKAKTPPWAAQYFLEWPDR